ncbi:MAG: hypothetical protein OIF51_08705, partial [Cellvibrionaceae bacterium]|nr:hypothetical protein [Cellvibrionaceae bacterium]
MANATQLHWNTLSGHMPASLANKCDLDQYQDDTLESPCDHQCFTKGEGNFWFRAFLFIGMITELLVVFVLPITVVGLCIIYGIAIYESENTNDFNIWFIEFSIYCFSFFLACALFQLYYQKLAYINGNVPFFIKLYREFELCRQTGLVHIYKKDKEAFSAPFYEFDCYLASNPGNYGELFYTMQLVHRYNGTKHTVDLGGLIGNSAPIEEYYQLWNMMQQYMDISRPMPDTIMSEAYRHLDPTTAEYDKKTGRDSHFWRNMTQEQYDEELQRREKAQRSLPLEGED